MSNKTGGPAFPTEATCEYQNARGEHAIGTRLTGGMTLRDRFAIAALPACYAQICSHCDSHGWPEGWRAGIADDAYEMADAMFKAREAA